MLLSAKASSAIDFSEVERGRESTCVCVWGSEKLSWSISTVREREEEQASWNIYMYLFIYLRKSVRLLVVRHDDGACCGACFVDKSTAS